MMWSKNLAGLWLSALTFFIGFFEPRIVGAFTPRTNADLLRQENIAETQQRVMEKWTVLPIPELNARPFKFGAYLFLGTNSGDVYRSLDDGQTWEKVDSGIPDGALVNQFMAVGEVIFAGTYHKGLFRSTDLGNNWVAVNSGLEYSTGSSTAVRRIMMMAAFKSTLFAATDSVSQYN